MSVAIGRDDLWLGVKSQSNSEIAGFLRNLFRWGVKIDSRIVTKRGKSTPWERVAQSLTDSKETPNTFANPLQTDFGCKGPKSRGKKPRSYAKVSKR